MSEDKWSRLEKEAAECLSNGDISKARANLSVLEAKFGTDSGRVSLLRGMVLEASRQFSEARAVYNTILEANGANQLAAKRLVVLRRAEESAAGRDGDAAVVTELVKYLDTFASDAEAWSDLADAYLRLGAHDLAAFALEECVLLKPFDVVLHTRLGEACLAGGRAEKARSHFSAAVKFSHSSYPRALFGLRVATQPGSGGGSGGGGGGSGVGGGGSGSGSAGDTSLNASLHTVAGEKLDALYAAAKSDVPAAHSSRREGLK